MSTQTMIISHSDLLKVLNAVAASGTQVYAPVSIRQKVFFAPVADAKDIVFDYIQSAESPKEVLLPRVERLLSFTTSAGTVTMTDHAEEKFPERVLFGSRPCDAAGLARLAEFFQRDISDAFVARRRKALTIISMSCTKADADCFCTAVGTSPGDTTGSDMLLTPVGGERYLVECITEKGSAFAAAHGSFFMKGDAPAKEQFLAKVAAGFAAEAVTKNLNGAFSSPFWNDASLRCIGCGACAFVCPVCSCFDIEDEGTEARGRRVRCWDSCGFALFTLHTSGHNPRHIQSERWRQRVLHKFLYEPDQMHFAGCIGCGRCSRACPADMNLKEQLTAVAAGI